MKKAVLFFAVLAFAAPVLSDQNQEPSKTVSVYEMPQLWPRHNQLRQELIGAVRRGDIRTMEAVCRAALELMPDDATWHYNLACALAYRENPDNALAELDRAITFGFRNADAIAKDSDLARLASHPRFAELVTKARRLGNSPVAGRPFNRPAEGPAGHPITLTETNLVWNFDLGCFNALLALKQPAQPVTQLAAHYSLSKPTSPERPYVAAWLSEGTAAGNTGDLYLNRDGGHSLLAARDFPNLTPVNYDAAAQKFGTHLDHPNTFFGGAPVFGNISRGRTAGPFWRSLARASFTDPGVAARMDLFYRNNQFWVIPAVKDYGVPEIGDVFPANAPFQFVTHGLSWSDQPFLRAALAASAALRPETKQAVLKRYLMGPTLQWLLRRTQKGVTNEEAYLAPGAHPAAFDATRLDPLALVEKAHALAPGDIPPAVSLTLVNSRLFPIRYPEAGRDYPDSIAELIMAVPSALAFVLRAPEGERSFLVRAQPFPETTENVSFTWRVVNGPASLVKISVPLGETLNTPEKGFAQITVDRRSLTNRLDVACFATHNGETYGAPSIVSFYPLPQEKRVYRADGKIQSIDYSNPDGRYSDPVLALPRHWKDTYAYAPDGTPRGFTRSYGGKDVASFTPTGERIVSRRPDGTPQTLVRVKYTPRGTGNRLVPYELTYTDDGDTFPAPPSP